MPNPSAVSPAAAANLPIRSPSAPAQPAWPIQAGQPAAAVDAHTADARLPGSTGHGTPPPMSAQAQTALTAEFSSVLQAGVHGLCFSPYYDGQAPGAQVSDAQIRLRLGLMRPTLAASAPSHALTAMDRPRASPTNWASIPWKAPGWAPMQPSTSARSTA